MDIFTFAFADLNLEKRGEGVMNWEIGIDIYTLICIK